MAGFRTSATGTTLLPLTTPCLIATPSLLRLISFCLKTTWDYALVVGSTMTFFYLDNTSGFANETTRELSPTFQLATPPVQNTAILPLNALADVAIGAAIIVANASNQWVPATVNGDENSAYSNGGQSYPLTSRAVLTSNLTGTFTGLKQGATFPLFATAPDGGLLWATPQAPAVIAFFSAAASVTTFGALLGAGQVLIEIAPGTWTVGSS